MSTILARRMVAQQNILSRQRAALKRNVDILSQPNDRGGVDGQLSRMKNVAVVLLDPRDAFEDHHHRAPFGAHIYWLKRSIQY